MTTPEQTARSSSELAAGFLATLSILASGLALAYRPVRLIPLAVILALIAAGMAPRNSKLPLIAILVAAVAFVVASTIAVLSDNPLY